MPYFHIRIDGEELDGLYKADTPEDARRHGVVIAASILPEEMPEVVVEFATVCKHCGSPDVESVEDVPASAGIQNVVVVDSEVEFEWTGTTRYGDGETIGFRCGVCFAEAPTLEVLFGLEPDPEAAQTPAEPELRSWWWIMDANSRVPLTRVTARDGFDALCAYSEAEGFVPYIHPDKASDQERDEGVVAFIHEGKWHGTFTNLNIYAEQDKEGTAILTSPDGAEGSWTLRRDET